MSVQSILPKKTVSVSELRKRPYDYVMDETVAVLSNNKTAGYMLSTKLYESVVKMLGSQTKTSQFKPFSVRLAVITESGQGLLLDASKEDLIEFSE